MKMKCDLPREWLAQAEEDLEYGRLGLDGYPRASCWQFQQAAEKSLKALLLQHEVSFPKTHDIARILTLVAELGFNVDDLREAAFRLTTLVPAMRYPGDFPDLSHADAKQAEADAWKVYEWVSKRFQNLEQEGD